MRTALSHPDVECIVRVQRPNIVSCVMLACIIIGAIMAQALGAQGANLPFANHTRHTSLANYSADALWKGYASGSLHDTYRASLHTETPDFQPRGVLTPSLSTDFPITLSQPCYTNESTSSTAPDQVPLQSTAIMSDDATSCSATDIFSSTQGQALISSGLTSQNQSETGGIVTLIDTTLPTVTSISMIYITSTAIVTDTIGSMTPSSVVTLTTVVTR